MELSCTEVPLYGHVDVFAKFEKNIYLPEDAEFYFIYTGSTCRHVMFAHRLSDNTLQSVVPGHRSQETVSITVCMYTMGYSPVTVGCGSITYAQDTACMLANELLSQAGSLTSDSHQTLLECFGLTVGDLLVLDHQLALAMSCTDYPTSWGSGGETIRKESLLQLSMRWGLVRLSKFLASLPGGSIALTLPNDDGETPLELAAQNGHTKLVEMFQNLPEVPPSDFSSALIGDSAFLRLDHQSDVLTLTFNHTTEHSLEDDIKLSRRCLWDRTFLSKVLSLKDGGTEAQQKISYLEDTEEDSVSQISRSSSPQAEDVETCQNILGQPCENESQDIPGTEKKHSSLDVLKKYKQTPALLAASSLSAMMNGHDEVYTNYMVVNQHADLDLNYISIDKATSDASSTDLADSASESCTIPSPQDKNHIENRHAEPNQTPANGGESADRGSCTPDRRASGSPHPPFRPREFKFQRGPAYYNIKKRSSSLDGLDADSESEGNSDRPHNTFDPVNLNPRPIGSSGDELDSFETNSEVNYNINRMESTSLLSKELLASGTRLRSYSCSSPKSLPGKSRVIRDVAASDSIEDGVFHSGRSLLQALSLSKSMSLLHPSKQRAYSLPEQIKQQRIEEEEWDKYMAPAKAESEKYTMSRTLSFLKNRMSSTRNKSKTKNKDSKDKEKSNRHHFVAGTLSGVIPCLVCEKALLGKESLQCSHCNVNVHKNCKDSAPLCTKKSKEKNQTKPRHPTVSTSPSFAENAQLMSSLSMRSSSSLPISLSGARQEASLPVSKSVPIAIFERSSMEPDADAYASRPRSQSEESLQLVRTPPSADTFPIEDVVDSPLLGDLCVDALELEAETWSLAVDPSFCSKQEKDVIKRQDVIFELMQTELHHIQTLFIMSEIFRKGMKDELQLDHSTVDKIFPCLDELLDIHKEFFNNMKERRLESSEDTDRNFIISRIGDILVQQFSEENAEKMKQIYGEFCSHHKEAVNIFKELQQNKKFQNFIRLRNSNLLARRRGIPECILLVTQRITKYPVLVERILRYTKEATEEHKDLCKALGLIKNMIAAVDLRVNEFEKEQKLMEILNKIENKTCTKLKNGNTFRKQDLTSKERILVHEGLVYWKTATGRLKDTSALLLNDILLFLQEKDQKFVFAAVDQKPPVISLQKLIVREVANEERGMFLISASSAGPEMYEIHTNSKDERNTWMRHIQEAVQSFPEEEEENTCESDEDKRVTEARTAQIQKFQESLSNQDQQICGILEEKLHIYTELAGMSAGEDVHLEPHLLVKPDPCEIPHATSLLTAALREADNLHVAVTSQLDSTISSLEESSETSASPNRLTSYDSADEILASSSESLNTEVKEGGCSDSDLSVCQIQTEVEESYSEDKMKCGNGSGITQAEIVQAIQNLTRLLYSIQAAVTIQDSHIELHKVLLHEGERTARGHISRGSMLQEKEKYRNLEKHREEAANLNKLQHQFHQEQQRWYRECEQRLREQEQKETWLQEREKECQSQEELLQKKKEELGLQFQDYQQNLERLKEGQRLVVKEKEKLHVQQKLMRHLKHTRHSSLPVMVLPSMSEVVPHSRNNSLRSEESLHIAEALGHMSVNSPSNSNPQPFCADEDLARTSALPSDHAVNNSHYSGVTCEQWRSNSLHRTRTEYTSQLSKGDGIYDNGPSTEDLSCTNYPQRENASLKSSSPLDSLLKSPPPRHQDLNALQFIIRGAMLSGTYSPNPTGSQRQHTSETLPNPHSDVSQDVESGNVEENIVYL
ncbi:rho guanine nucleotide exchange factor 28 isoform X2 [Pleurodeles waltl]|uniref:rho guanine nucleotide exchange factor 28 isoform X2 n=1 Tax=Pleurodeles waltl TaxID=8319 RepID=UPI003709B977